MVSSKVYRAILFDVGSTLLEIARNPNEIAAESIAHLGALSAEDFAAAIREIVAEWRIGGGRPEVQDLPETWHSHNRLALSRIGFTGDIALAAEIIESTFLSEGLRVYPDVEDVLTRLVAEGYSLGIVSNWPSTLEATLRRARLNDYFPVIVGSGNVGYAKPHPQIFRIAMNRIGVNPDETLYIGDSVEYDVAGARAAGMDVLLLDRAGTGSHQPRIQTLLQLSEFLEAGSLGPTITAR